MCNASAVYGSLTLSQLLVVRLWLLLFLCILIVTGSGHFRGDYLNVLCLYGRHNYLFEKL